MTRERGQERQSEGKGGQMGPHGSSVLSKSLTQRILLGGRGETRTHEHYLEENKLGRKSGSSGWYWAYL